MKLQQEGKWEEARTLYRDILESEVMEGGAATEAPPSGTILRLKFLVYKNIASVARQQGDYSAAADAYIEVSICLISPPHYWHTHLPHPLALRPLVSTRVMSLCGANWPAWVRC